MYQARTGYEDCRGETECCRTPTPWRKTAWAWLTWKRYRCTACWQRSRGPGPAEYQTSADPPQATTSRRSRTPTRCRPWARRDPLPWRSCSFCSCCCPSAESTPPRDMRPGTMSAACTAEISAVATPALAFPMVLMVVVGVVLARGCQTWR